MKNVWMFIALLVLSFCVSAKEKIEIAAGQKVELSYEEFATYDVKLINVSGRGGVNVSVLSAGTGKKIKGFGLGPMGNVIVSVGKGNVLRLKNASSKSISISLKFVEKKTEATADLTKKWVSLTLHNSSLKSIPLVIPSVMNPNLSPMSNSGVRLAVGQKVYYKKGMAKRLLFEVDGSIADGDKIDVAKRIKKLEQGL